MNFDASGATYRDLIKMGSIDVVEVSLETGIADMMLSY